MKKYTVIILANGKSERFGKNKLIQEISGEMVILRSIRAFLQNPNFNQWILVSNDEVFNLIPKEIKSKLELVKGGDTRTDSVRSCINLVKGEKVFIHDGARPFISQELIGNLSQAIKNFDAAVPKLDVTDCLKQITKKGPKTVDRNNYFTVQTPQVFDTKIIRDAYNKHKGSFFDDLEVLEKFKPKAKINYIQGDKSNTKITFKEDIF